MKAKCFYKTESRHPQSCYSIHISKFPENVSEDEYVEEAHALYDILQKFLHEKTFDYLDTIFAAHSQLK